MDYLGLEKKTVLVAGVAKMQGGGQRRQALHTVIGLLDELDARVAVFALDRNRREKCGTDQRNRDDQRVDLARDGHAAAPGVAVPV